MEHVRVAEHDVCPSPDRTPRILRCVAVVGEHADLEVASAGELIRQGVQLGQLILRQCLGRKQVQSAR
jgi:hypothetical protein